MVIFQLFQSWISLISQNESKKVVEATDEDLQEISKNLLKPTKYAARNAWIVYTSLMSSLTLKVRWNTGKTGVSRNFEEFFAVEIYRDSEFY